MSYTNRAAARPCGLLTAEIKSLIVNTLTELLRTNPGQPNGSASNSQPQANSVAARIRTPLDGFDTLPDVVKTIGQFSGDRSEFLTWYQAVERVMKVYEPLKGTAKYYGIVLYIRNQIVGPASILLNVNNVPCNLESICKCLESHYSEKKDISVLDTGLVQLFQGTQSLDEYYMQICNQLSQILRHIENVEIGNDQKESLIKFYKLKALDTFISGVNGELSRILFCRNPQNLEEALKVCKNYEDMIGKRNVAGLETNEMYSASLRLNHGKNCKRSKLENVNNFQTLSPCASKRKLPDPISNDQSQEDESPERSSMEYSNRIPYFLIEVKDRPLLKVLVDTGSSLSYIVKREAIEQTPREDAKSRHGVNTPLRHVNVKFCDEYIINLIVIKNESNFDMLLGYDALTKLEAVVDVVNHKMTLGNGKVIPFYGNPITFVSFQNHL